MTQLKRIGISNVKERDENDLWVSVEKLTMLQSLDLMASNEDEILPVKAQCPPLLHFQKLHLIGRLQCKTGFVKMERLELLNFASVKKITIEKGVMPNLRYLLVYNFMELKTVPLGLECLSNIQYLGLAFVPVEVIQPIWKGGEDRSKVQHIHEIIHVFKQSSKWVHENLA
ncbi:putative leucine-rich repeat domain, L domain-containing protein [Rosa chinensis]|uniref:Putative leucine-rich repeat domain, L domain-containing protein n=1 Tax=Rosa chinensis TaxID=74649 RepID=A0A2P6Q6Q8_ROSCH|nr:putative leucine-rich repeat domain, L domain-containing protein [Rosa chinensis]